MQSVHNRRDVTETRGVRHQSSCCVLNMLLRNAKTALSEVFFAGCVIMQLCWALLML